MPSKVLSISMIKTTRVILLHLISRISILLLAISILASLAIAAEEKGVYTIDLSTNESLGSYMVNQTGFTLYYFIGDPGDGSSTCYDDCLEFWPVFYAENITLPESLNSSDFAPAIRKDGLNQTAYKGWPLYLYYEDSAPGDLKGHGKDGVWFVLSLDDFIIIEA